MILTDLVILLAVACAGMLLGRVARIPPMVAYLVAGVLAGPALLSVIGHSAAIEQIADLGVALLLFGIGIEFSLERLRKNLTRIVFTGLAQVLLTIVVAVAIFVWLGRPWAASIVVGCLVSLSSTAVVFKLYQDKGELQAPHGQAAAGVLLFQDLALLPMMLVLPVLDTPTDGALVASVFAFVRAGLAVAVILVLARALFPRLLRMVAKANTPELFPPVAVFIAFGTALCASYAGLSLPIGAFLAGLSLSGSTYAYQVFAEILPLRDAFVAVFFTSVGMLFDAGVLFTEPGLVLAMIAAVALKGLICAAVIGLAWRSARLGVLAGFALAQIGEFSFVLSREAVALGLLPGPLEQAFLGAAVFSMAATPFLIPIAERYAGREDTEPQVAGEMSEHVLIVGYGGTGQSIGRVLKETGIASLALDTSPDRVRDAKREGQRILFGDGSRRAILQAAAVAKCRAAVVAVGDPAGTRRIVARLRQLNPDMRIIVRAKRVDEIEELERLGANEVVPAEFEASIEMFVRLLTHLGVPRHVSRLQEGIIRLGRYSAMRGSGVSAELLPEIEGLIRGGILETAEVMEGSRACGKSLAELDLRGETGASILTMVREERPMTNPDGATRLQAGDLVVIYGPHGAIAAALEIMERPLGVDTPTV